MTMGGCLVSGTIGAGGEFSPHLSREDWSASRRFHLQFLPTSLSESSPSGFVNSVATPTETPDTRSSDESDMRECMQGVKN